MLFLNEKLETKNETKKHTEDKEKKTKRKKKKTAKLENDQKCDAIKFNNQWHTCSVSKFVASLRASLTIASTAAAGWASES